MVIDDEYRECVCFLCVDEQKDAGGTGKKEKATGFFVEMYITPNSSVCYLVTARHVLDQSRRSGTLYAKVNLRSGGFKYVAVPQGDWYCHALTDIAVIFFVWDSEYRIRFIPSTMFADANYLKYSGVDPGDDVFFLGLFSGYSGEEQAEPIARFGQVSLGLKNVPVRLNSTSTKKVDGYLVETRSWGGESGSPTFHIKWPTSAAVRVRYSDPKLIGLLQGHYDISKQSASGEDRVGLNSGIGIVIPVAALLEVLNEPGLVEERERHTKKLEGSVQTPTLDPLFKEYEK